MLIFYSEKGHKRIITWKDLKFKVNQIANFYLNHNIKFLNPFKRIWIKFGEILGKVIAPLVLSIVYFIVITPIGLLLRIFGKDLLGIKFLKKKSYWIKRDKDLGSMKNQF